MSFLEKKRERAKTRRGAVLGCPGDSEAQSRWVFKLARSSARSTPREGTKHEKPGGRWAAARRPPGRPLAGGPAGRSAAARLATLAAFLSLPPSRFGATCCKCFNHYLSAGASQSLPVISACHRKPRRDPPKCNFLNSKLFLEIH